MKLTRRTLLEQVVATSGVVGLTGCAGDSAGSSPTPTTATGTSTPTATPTQTAADAQGQTETDTPTQTTTPPPERGDYTVGMYTELYFDPIGLYVEPGETVSFELVSGAHSATAYHPDNPNALERRIPDGAPAWDTEVFGDVGTFRNVTFETRGTHDYYCIPHKMVGMVGRIVVGEPGGPAEASENPDLKLPAASRIVEDGTVSFEDWQREQG